MAASLRERLRKLEAKAPAPQPERIPVVISVLLTANERHRATLQGNEPRPTLRRSKRRCTARTWR
jgi:hypothetical protein